MLFDFNRELKELIIAYENNKDLKLNSLELKLKGIIDAEVMGGITNYEKVRKNSLITRRMGQIIF